MQNQSGAQSLLYKKQQGKEQTEEEKQEEQLKFFKDHKDDLRKFGSLRDDFESEAFLVEVGDKHTVAAGGEFHTP